MNLPSASAYVYGSRLDGTAIYKYYEVAQQEIIGLAVKSRREGPTNPRAQNLLSVALRKIGLTTEDLHDAAAIDNFDIIDRIDGAIDKLERRRNRILQEFRNHRSIGVSLSLQAFETIVDHFEKGSANDT